MSVPVLYVGTRFTERYVNATRLANERSVNVLPITRPKGHGHAIAHVQRTSHHVIVFSPIRPFRHFKLVITGGLLSIGIASGMLNNASPGMASQVRISCRHPLFVIQITICQGFCRVQTFRLTKLGPMAFAPATRVNPFLRILQQVRARLFVNQRRRRPLLVKDVPRCFQVARVFRSIGQDRGQVLFVFNGHASIIDTVNRALCLPIFVANQDMRNGSNPYPVSNHVNVVRC